MKKSYVVLILCTFLVLPGYSASKKEKAQKPVKMSTLYKAASTAIKNASGQDGARTNLINALSRPELKNKDKAEIFYTAAKLYESSNSVENRKACLKQQYDTAMFFNTLLNMYEQLRLCDSVDAVPNAQQKVKLKYSKKTYDLRQKHIKNKGNEITRILSSSVSKMNSDINAWATGNMPKEPQSILRALSSMMFV